MATCEQIITDTIQLGGVLVFIKDQGPDFIHALLAPLSTDFENQIPFVVRELKDLRSGKYKTRAEDLILFFDQQLDFLYIRSESPIESSLGQILQGQRILFSDKQSELAVDHIFPAITLADWSAILANIKRELVSGVSLYEYVNAQEVPCLFLDRDNVVVHNIPYNRDASQVELMPGIVELIDQAHKRGYWVALVTNQSGIGRGRISWLEYKDVHQRMMALLAEQKSWIDDCMWSSFIENETVTEGRLRPSLRKPRSGMFQIIHEKLRTKLSESIMIGDSASDLVAAHSAGVAHLFLLHSDKVFTEIQTLNDYQGKLQQKPQWTQFYFQVLEKLKDFSF
jgi:D-glycero-D-manno-heptose 1,7-bisphosphate phosphatase